MGLGFGRCPGAQPKLKFPNGVLVQTLCLVLDPLPPLPPLRPQTPLVPKEPKEKGVRWGPKEDTGGTDIPHLIETNGIGILRIGEIP